MNAFQAKNLLERIAELSVGASTVRNAGAKRVAERARTALKRIDIEAFQVSTRDDFLEELERETNRINRYLPLGARHWGVARKVSNIFLRACVQNRPLARHYGLSKIEKWLELPLDSHVADGIKLCSKNSELPIWTTINGLDVDTSDEYQKAARSIARIKKVNAIDLESCWWRTGIKRCRRRGRIVVG